MAVHDAGLNVRWPAGNSIEPGIGRNSTVYTRVQLVAEDHQQSSGMGLSLRQ